MPAEQLYSPPDDPIPQLCTTAARNGSVRKRKAHTKSRRGCGNCKLRRVKCDEGQPQCQKCKSFGVSCSYDSKASSLEFAGMGAFQVSVAQIEIPDELELLINGMLHAPVALHVEEGREGPHVMHLDETHVDLLRKFQSRTVLTIGTQESSKLYRAEFTKMAARHSFCLHSILRFTLMHDRYLFEPVGAKPSTLEAFHGYHGAALFSQRLFNPLEEHEKDAMWATAAILGSSAFASIEGGSAEEAWPLKMPELQDLDWLKMSDGKKEVWRLADPLREGSVFREAIEVEQAKRIPPTHRPTDPVLDALYPWVTKLYNPDSPRPDDSDASDPYQTAASIVERLLPIECNYSTIMWFLSFIGHMDPAFRTLLEEKDPQALAILSWWYAKVIPYEKWWVHRRAVFECQSICLYLDKMLDPRDEKRKLLEYPSMICGLQSQKSSDKDQLFHTLELKGTAWPWKLKF